MKCVRQQVGWSVLMAWGLVLSTAAPLCAIDNPNDEALRRRDHRKSPKERVQDADGWKKNPPIWSIDDPRGEDDKNPIVHPYAFAPQPSPGPGQYPGGPFGAWGLPYYYTNTNGTPLSPGSPGYPAAAAPVPVDGVMASGFNMQPPYAVPPMAVDPGLYGGMGYGGAGYGGAAYGGMGYGYGAAGYGAPGYGYGMGGPGLGYGGGFAYGGGFGPYGAGGPAAFPGGLPNNPYYYHFGPGFYRYNEAGHYRFPYFSYRRPWYFPGHPSYNRDTNIPW